MAQKLFISSISYENVFVLIIQFLLYCNIKMNDDSKFCLRNASNFLNTIRRKYNKEPEDSNLMHNKTFIEQQSLEMYENDFKQSSKQNSPNKEITKQAAQMQNLSEIKFVKKQEITFCDRLIVNKLQETLKIYEQDMNILLDNKQCLEQNIEMISEKIRKLKQLEISNKILSRQNQKAKTYLEELIKQYHISMGLSYKVKLQQQQAFNSLRSKVRMVIKEVGEDYYYIGFIQYWNNYIENIQYNRSFIQSRAQNFVRQQNKKQKQQAKPIKIIRGGQKQANSRIDEEDYQAPDEPKPKKKLSQSEKAMLLGDLKSFAKNFKFPSG